MAFFGAECVLKPFKYFQQNAASRKDKYCERAACHVYFWEEIFITQIALRKQK
jgi:hypothetical protein